MDPDLKEHLNHLEQRHRLAEEHFRQQGLQNDPVVKEMMEQRRNQIDLRREAYQEMSFTGDPAQVAALREAVRSAPERVRSERLRQEQRVMKAHREITERPGDPAVQKEYRAAVREARSAFPWVPRSQTPDFRGDFERAHAGRPKKRSIAKSKAVLELNPPRPRGMGQGIEPREPQVSPQLRDQDTREAAADKALEKMLLAQEFNRKGRDSFER